MFDEIPGPAQKTSSPNGLAKSSFSILRFTTLTENELQIGSISYRKSQFIFWQILQKCVSRKCVFSLCDARF